MLHPSKKESEIIANMALKRVLPEQGTFITHKANGSRRVLSFLLQWQHLIPCASTILQLMTKVTVRAGTLQFPGGIECRKSFQSCFLIRNLIYKGQNPETQEWEANVLGHALRRDLNDSEDQIIPFKQKRKKSRGWGVSKVLARQAQGTEFRSPPLI